MCTCVWNIEHLEILIYYEFVIYDKYFERATESTVAMVIKMKENRKPARILINVSKKVAKNEINSTSSPWLFQPKLPKIAMELKKK